MAVSEAVRGAVSAAVRANMGDVTEAKKAALVAVRALDEYETFVGELVEAAVGGMVHDLRHNLNASLAAQMRAGNPAQAVPGAKVNMLASAAVGQVYKSVYTHAIAGRTLGDLTADDLTKLRDDEANRAKGHQFNADLCDWCLKRVKDGQTVKEAIPEKDLERAYKRLKNKSATPAVLPAV